MIFTFIIQIATLVENGSRSALQVSVIFQISVDKMTLYIKLSHLDVSCFSHGDKEDSIHKEVILFEK